MALPLDNLYLGIQEKEPAVIGTCAHCQEEVREGEEAFVCDKATDFSRDMQLLNAGIMNDWEFRMKWMNEDEETAKAALPKMQDMTTDGQDEVE